MCDCNKTTNDQRAKIDARTLQQLRRDAIKTVRLCDKALYDDPAHTIPERQR